MRGVNLGAVNVLVTIFGVIVVRGKIAIYPCKKYVLLIPRSEFAGDRNGVWYQWVIEVLHTHPPPLVDTFVAYL